MEQEQEKEGKKGFNIKQGIIFVFLFAFVVVFAVILRRDSGQNGEEKEIVDTSQLSEVVVEETTNPSNGQVSGEEVVDLEMVNELVIEDLVVGEGDEAIAGTKASVNYLGTLTDGTKFDSSYDRGTPFSFNLGAGEVIQGWDQGVAGMKVGGKRKLTIPSHLAYGEAGAGGTIPPNATLIFEVELLGVESK